METNDQVNILLVDDRPENLLALEATLAELGQNLIKANSGAEALRCVLKQDFAAILLDVQMPEMDGFETAALIRERERSKSTPIIFITAISKSEQEAFKGYAVGAVDYVFKPIVPEILRAKVRVFVDLYQKAMAIRQQAAQLEAVNATLQKEIAERERAEAEIQALYANLTQKANELARANEELEAFSYSTSHDLRAPLRTMQSFSQFLLEDYAERLDETGKDYLQRIAAAAMRMDDLIQDLLAYSRLSRTEMELKPLHLKQAITETMAELATVIRESHAQIETDDVSFWVIGHRATVNQVIANLLTNAVKFIPPGASPQVRVWAERRAVAARASGSQPANEGASEDGRPRFVVRLWVEDNGIGIAPEHQERIFHPFERLHGRETYPGTGIGLAIVRKGMERMGGCAGVESELGHGSRFWIELPQA